MPSAHTTKNGTLGWRFENSYARLPEHFYTRLSPETVNAPECVIVNHALGTVLGLSLDQATKAELAQIFSGNALPEGAEPIAQAYAGHQFGHFTYLGDGRAHLLGEHLTPDGTRVDIQLKGSGQTPYGLRGDGKAALEPMLREYIISEAMYALGIPTTRSLAVVSTGEPVMRETVLKGAVLTRIASSHVRCGTFEYLAAEQDKEGLRRLADYTIDRHYPDIKDDASPPLALIDQVMTRHIALVVQWLRVGFIHGVMNTDNMALSGETIDYGPCAFMDNYDPNRVFSSIDQIGRYAFANQPRIAKWNLARFAETLLPLIDPNDMESAMKQAEKVLDAFDTRFQTAWRAMMRGKLGLCGEEPDDNALIGSFLQWMQRHERDYTNSFQDLMGDALPEDEAYESEAFVAWHEQWQKRRALHASSREASLAVMREHNPYIIPRNYRVEEALADAEDHADYTKLHALLQALAQPYDENDAFEELTIPPGPAQYSYRTFCGT